jgi:hypothetical protein
MSSSPKSTGRIAPVRSFWPQVPCTPQWAGVRGAGHEADCRYADDDTRSLDRVCLQNYFRVLLGVAFLLVGAAPHPGVVRRALLVVGRPARLGFSVGYEGLKSSREPPLPDICVLLAEKAGEQVRVVAERLLCEALDPWPEHVAVNRGPVDPTEGRVGVVFDRELH